ncbi:MAG: hypothetical protein ALAOOOJD_03375 [bacterium]|nr:hypothetical protein [bacterium]
MLDRLMRRAVFADADAVMGENINGRLLHQTGQTKCRPLIIRKDEKRRNIRTQFAQRHAVGNRTHRIFANAEMKISAVIIAFLKIAAVFDQRFGRGRQIRGATHEPGNLRGDGIQNFAVRFAAGETFRIRRENRQRLFPAGRNFTILQHLKLLCEIRISRRIRGEFFIPFRFKLPAFTEALFAVAFDFSGHKKFFIRIPAINFFGGADFFFTQRLTVRAMRVLFGGTAIRNVAVDDNQRRALIFFQRRLHRAFQ